jgi:hypothetical protein
VTPDQLAARLHIPHQRRDPLLAAAALEAATADMHAAAVAAGPPLTADEFAAAVDPVPDPVAFAQDAVAAAYARLDDPDDPDAPNPDLPGFGIPVPAPEVFDVRAGDAATVAAPAPAPPPPGPVPAEAPADITGGSPAPAQAATLTPPARADDLPPSPATPPGNSRTADSEAAPAFTSERSPLAGWAPRHDPASRLYGVRDHVLAGSAPLVDVLLPRGPILDQGAEGACVGFGTVDAANALALVRWKARGYTGGPSDLLTAADALAAYREDRTLDDIPGEAYEGTSVLAGMRGGQARGWWHSYWWSFSVRDTAQTLLQLRTPLVIGVPWFREMFTPGPGGVVRVAGDFMDGHCVAVVGLRRTGPGGLAGPWFVIQNSYGASWGDGGLGLIHHRDFAFLISHDGEQAIPQAAS